MTESVNTPHSCSMLNDSFAATNSNVRMSLMGRQASYNLPTELPESRRRRGAERLMGLPVAAARLASVM